MFPDKFSGSQGGWGLGTHSVCGIPQRRSDSGTFQVRDPDRGPRIHSLNPALFPFWDHLYPINLPTWVPQNYGFQGTQVGRIWGAQRPSSGILGGPSGLNWNLLGPVGTPFWEHLDPINLPTWVPQNMSFRRTLPREPGLICYGTWARPLSDHSLRSWGGVALTPPTGM